MVHGSLLGVCCREQLHTALGLTSSRDSRVNKVRGQNT
jgi:hypothetical protein